MVENFPAPVDVGLRGLQRTVRGLVGQVHEQRSVSRVGAMFFDDLHGSIGEQARGVISCGRAEHGVVVAEVEAAPGDVAAVILTAPPESEKVVKSSFQRRVPRGVKAYVL